MAKTVKKSDTTASGKAGGGKAAKSADAKGTNVKRSSSKAAPARRQRTSGRGAKAEKKGGFGKFLRDVRVELSKVTWPTRSDLTQSTIVVLVAVAIAGAFTGLIDLAFQQFVKIIGL